MTNLLTDAVKPAEVSAGTDGLRISLRPAGEDSLNAVLTWSLSPEFAALVAQYIIYPVKLLVVVRNGITQMSRYLFPITDKQGYISFHRSGENVVHAAVVYGERAALNEFLKRYGESSWECSSMLEDRRTENVGRIADEIRAAEERIKILPRRHKTSAMIDVAQLRRARDLASATSDWGFECDYPGQTFVNERYSHRAYSSVRRFAPQAALRVMVDRGHFAQNWPTTKWLAGLVTWGLPKPINGCPLRKRAMVNAAASPLILAYAAICGVLLGLATLLLLVWGSRDINFAGFKTLDIGEVPWDDLEPSRWWTRKEIDAESGYTSYPDRSTAHFLINPPSVLAVIAVIAAAWLIPGIREAVIGIVAVVALVLLAVAGIGYAIAKRRERKNTLAGTDAAKLALEAREAKRAAAEKALIAKLAGETVEPTLHMRWHDLKYMVCRPIER